MKVECYTSLIMNKSNEKINTISHYNLRSDDTFLNDANLKHCFILLENCSSAIGNKISINVNEYANGFDKFNGTKLNFKRSSISRNSLESKYSSYKSDAQKKTKRCQSLKQHKPNLLSERKNYLSSIPFDHGLIKKVKWNNNGERKILYLTPSKAKLRNYLELKCYFRKEGLPCNSSEYYFPKDLKNEIKKESTSYSNSKKVTGNVISKLNSTVSMIV